MRPDVIPFFTIATTSSGLPSIAIRFWKELCVNEYEPSSDRRPGNWACRSSQAFCPESMSTCSSRYHPISRSATLCAGSKAVPRTECRWSSQSFANVTGDATSGREATSARPAATSRMKRYFSISGIMNLPASAGSYSVPMGATPKSLSIVTIFESARRFPRRVGIAPDIVGGILGRHLRCLHGGIHRLEPRVLI